MCRGDFHGAGSRRHHLQLPILQLGLRGVLGLLADLRCAFVGTLDPNLHTQKADHSALSGKVGLCAMLNSKATDEPRRGRTPWREFSYADGVECATKLWLALKTMEDSIPGQDDKGSTEASIESFNKMLALPPFDKIREGVSGKLVQLRRFVKMFMHETEDTIEDLKCMV